MPEQQLPDESNPMHITEPLTVRLYGMKDITLPAYLLWFLATILLVGVLITAARETVEPHTQAGERLHRMVQGEPWAITLAEWIPPSLMFGLAFEFVEAVVVFYAFARRARQRDRQPTDRHHGLSQ